MTIKINIDENKITKSNNRYSTYIIYTDYKNICFVIGLHRRNRVIFIRFENKNSVTKNCLFHLFHKRGLS